jgi:hypothetical protein
MFAIAYISALQIQKWNSDFRIVIGNMPIKQVNTTKSLGVMIDETLTWRSQVDL